MRMNQLLWVGFAVAGLGLAGCGDDTSGASGSASASSGLDPTDSTPTATTSGAGTTTSGTTDGVETTTPTSSAEPGEDETVGPPVVFDVNDPTGGASGCQGAPNDLTLTGTVWAPNGVIPVSGALVYTSSGPPAGIPQEVYCAECEELDCDDRFTTTAADGSFELGTFAQGANYLVVQKGQFLRFTQINFGTGAEVVDDELTTLPGENDPDNGLFIPLIAVGDGSFDRLEDGLGKFGLGDTLISNFEEQLVPGTEPFDLYDNGRNPASDGFPSQGTFAQLVSSPEMLSQYHMIFAPCSSDTYVSALTPTNIQNIRDWVAAGGRWYVSDWANEWINLAFPEYQQLSCPGGSCDNGVYNSNASILDDGLLEWLEALPDPLKDINPLNDESAPHALPTPDGGDGRQLVRHSSRQPRARRRRRGRADRRWPQGLARRPRRRGRGRSPADRDRPVRLRQDPVHQLSHGRVLRLRGAEPAGAGAALHDPGDRGVSGSAAASAGVSCAAE